MTFLDVKIKKGPRQKHKAVCDVYDCYSLFVTSFIEVLKAAAFGTPSKQREQNSRSEQLLGNDLETWTRG